jgi:zinc transport system substrate-binding protein
MVAALSACGNKNIGTLGSGNNSFENGTQKLKVVASFNAMAQFVKAIGKDKVDVITVVPNGVEPHDFEPKPKDLTNISEAKVFVYNGFGMETWVNKTMQAVNNKNLILVEAARGLSPIKTSAQTEDQSQYDPHTWMSLSYAKVEAKNIEDALIKADPSNKNYYTKNYDGFAAQLDALLNEYKTKFSALSNNSFVTGHAAFAYFCRDFNLKQNSVEDVFAEGEPTPKKLEELIQYCKQNNVKTIFVENMVSPKVSETLAKEVNAKVEKIYTIESEEDGKDYIQSMKYNLDKVYESLKS